MCHLLPLQFFACVACARARPERQVVRQDTCGVHRQEHHARKTHKYAPLGANSLIVYVYMTLTHLLAPSAALNRLSQLVWDEVLLVECSQQLVVRSCDTVP